MCEIADFFTGHMTFFLKILLKLFKENIISLVFKMDDELEQQFQKSVSLIRNHSTPISPDDLLILYGLYKKITQGDCNIPQPWSVQVEARAKWNAWFHNNNIPRNIAMQKYIEKVNQILQQ